MPITAPARMTVIRSATASTSFNLCVMKRIERPDATRDRMIPKSASVSLGVSTDVGSSRMRSCASRESAFRISTRCWTPTGRSSTSASGSTSRPNSCEIRWMSALARRRSSRPKWRVGSKPSTTFSATVNTGTSMKCWWTMPMPWRTAAPGSGKWTTSPSSAMSPESGCMSPNRTFMSVVLPAPFSPRSAWISPGSTVKSTWSSATRDPKVFVIPDNSSFTATSTLRQAAAPPGPVVCPRCRQLFRCITVRARRPGPGP